MKNDGIFSRKIPLVVCEQVLYMGGDVTGARDDGLDVVNLMHAREDVPGMEVCMLHASLYFFTIFCPFLVCSLFVFKR